MSTPIPDNRAAFTLEDVLAATGGTIARGEGGATEGVTTDTRRARPGQLFVALRGDRFDGHRFVVAAAEAGAKLALVEETLPEAPIAQVVVRSSLEALRALATLHRSRWQAAGGRVAAITGSAGKTTTKTVAGHLVEAIAPGQVVVTAGNLNNLVGAPLTVLSLGHRHRYAVLEVGTSEPGEIPKLASLTRPDVATVTLIDAAHTEGIGTIEDVAREKLSLFEGAREGALCIANLDDPRVRTGLARHPRAAGYGTDVAPADDPSEGAVRVLRREVTERGQRLSLAKGERVFTVEVPLLGYAGALAVAGGLAVAEALTGDELTAERIEGALVGCVTPGRLALRRGAETLVLDDSYNANPASCRASLRCAAEIAGAGGRRWGAVLGAMLELGDISEEEHRRVGALAAELGASWVIGVGGDAHVTVAAAAAGGASAAFVPDAEAAVESVGLHARAGDLVLVKGSRSIATERVAEALLPQGDGEPA